MDTVKDTLSNMSASAQDTLSSLSSSAAAAGTNAPSTAQRSDPLNPVEQPRDGSLDTSSSAAGLVDSVRQTVAQGVSAVSSALGAKTEVADTTSSPSTSSTPSTSAQEASPDQVADFLRDKYKSTDDAATLQDKVGDE